MPLSDDQMLRHLRRANQIAHAAMAAGHHPFGRVVYGLSERALLALTGAHRENPTLDLPCREVFARGQKPVQVIGPVPELEAEIAAPHRAFWARR